MNQDTLKLNIEFTIDNFKYILLSSSLNKYYVKNNKVYRNECKTEFNNTMPCMTNNIIVKYIKPSMLYLIDFSDKIHHNFGSDIDITKKSYKLYSDQIQDIINKISSVYWCDESIMFLMDKKYIFDKQVYVEMIKKSIETSDIQMLKTTMNNSFGIRYRFEVKICADQLKNIEMMKCIMELKIMHLFSNVVNFLMLGIRSNQSIYVEFLIDNVININHILDDEKNEIERIASRFNNIKALFNSRSIPYE